MKLRRGKRTDGAEPTQAERSPESAWFWDHYELAASQVFDFLDGSEALLAGRHIADVGCGDGILTLGLARRARARSVIGFDVNPVDVGHLVAQAHKEGVSADLPGELEFRISEPARLPVESGAFDFVSTWSAFEHIEDPLAVLKEICRILRPGGLVYLQLWPFYFSERGSHLWDWFPEPFHHLQTHEEVIVDAMNASDLKSKDWTAIMAREFRHLNRITLDELQRCILGAGLRVTKLELLTNTVLIPPGLDRYSLSELGITGVKLLATPA